MNATKKYGVLRRISFVLVLLIVASAPLHAKSNMKLWRLDCGRFNTAWDTFSDTFAYPAQRKTFSDGCYLIQHGNDLMLWDTGFSAALMNQSLDESKPFSAQLTKRLTDQLATIGFKSSDVTVLALSHYHSDHTGQAASFPQARLLMGQEDIDALKHAPYPYFTDPAPLQHWLSGDGTIDAIDGDRDVFGDATVIMVALPGHTPGNHGLLVKLPQSGIVLLSGDALHYTAQAAARDVPVPNVDRAASLASIERVQGIVKNTGAKLIIQHELDDIAKLPAFPEPAF